VAEAAALGWQFRFRRWMNPEIQSQWRCIRDDLVVVALDSERDKPRWKLTKSVFSVKSLYDKLSEVGVDRSLSNFGKIEFLSKSKSGYG
jgi:hypothetical protein